MADFAVDNPPGEFEITNTVDFVVDEAPAFQRLEDDRVFIRPSDNVMFVRQR